MADPLFTEEIVREFMLSHDGKVSNPVLVTHFKNFLNDPVRKVVNRQQFKTYVNNLASVKVDPSGVKLLVLKKKFRDGYEGESGASSESSVSAEKQTEPKLEKTMDIPKVTPQIEVVEQTLKETKEKKQEDNVAVIAEEPIVSIEGDINMKQSINDVTVNSDDIRVTHDDVIAKDDDISISHDINTKNDEITENEKTIVEKKEPEQTTMDEAPLNEATEKSDATNVTEVEEVLTVSKPQEAIPEEAGITINKSDDSTSINDESNKVVEDFGLKDTLQGLTLFNSYDSTSTLTSDQQNEDDLLTLTSANAQPLSLIPTFKDNRNKDIEFSVHEKPVVNKVKEAANMLNHNHDASSLSSTTSMTTSSSKSHLKSKRETRKPPEINGDTSDVMMMTDIDREWMLMSCKTDYQAMCKFLQMHPHLAPTRNPITGYNALHWACKNGNMDAVKLLCGKYSVEVNRRTQGGYTPLHLAAMGNHDNIVEQLVKVYKADANLRDYSGKLAKAYLGNMASNRSQQFLWPRKLGTIINYPTSMSSLTSSKNNNNNQLSISRPSSTSHYEKENASPINSPISTKPFRHQDYSSLMPPPAQLPNILRRKPTTTTTSHKPNHDDQSAHSDSEMTSNFSPLSFAAQLCTSSPDFGATDDGSTVV